MADLLTVEDTPLEEDDRPLIVPRPIRESVDLDITPLIDIVFLLLIFFLFTSIPDMQTEADLPLARYGQGVNARTAVILTVVDRGPSRPARVYLGDGKVGTPLPDDRRGQDVAILQALQGYGGTWLPDDPRQQEEIIRRTVERGYAEQGKRAVLVKAERGVLHREVAHVAAAAAQANGIEIDLNFAVVEVD